MEPDVPVINNGDELNEDECFNPGGGEINVEVDDSFTFEIRIFLLYLTYPEVSPLLSSTENEDTIFDPGIFAFYFSSQEPVVVKRFMEFCPSTLSPRTNKFGDRVKLCLLSSRYQSSVGVQKPGHLAARWMCRARKVATWDDLAFKLIILGWNVKHSILQNVDAWLKFKIAHSPKI
ncbi:hypothetical protein Tco_1387734 [Tanacetum coccineum]